jgi:hypothetical protein
MTSTAPKLDPETVVYLSEALGIENIVGEINRHSKLFWDTNDKIRSLEMRIDNFVPTTVHMRMPTNIDKIATGAAIGLAAAFCVVAYLEVRKDRKETA